MSENAPSPTAQPTSGCPVLHGDMPHPTHGDANREWWPNQLNLRLLATNPPAGNPLDEDFDYAAAFSKVDLPALNEQLRARGVPVIS